jgi:hypothetical protein
METEVRRVMWVWVTVGALFAAGVGLAAGDRGMITGALAYLVGGFLVTPFVARLWRRP